MIPAFAEPVRGNPQCEIRGGVASWDKGDGTEKSIKFTWFSKDGRAARGGEVPVGALPQMLEFAIRHGLLKLGTAEPQETDE